VNHYETLGVSPKDDTATIRRAYLAAARRSHPDFHVSAPEEERIGHARQMQAMNDAWAVLGDETARAVYDHDLRRGGDPGVARRVSREPGAPPGKGWTPRADDTGWMNDFAGWAAESDELAPDEPRSTSRRLLTLLPVGMFAASVGCVALGGILTSRLLLALAAVLFVISVGMFVFLPVLEMTRGRRG
jgi:curved DNA-binding protein CbpA